MLNRWRLAVTIVFIASVYYMFKSTTNELYRITFTVYGRVQGVYFRKYTLEYAQSIHLRGYVKNTIEGTVVGEAEGLLSDIQQFKHFLEFKGSPSSNIEKLESDIVKIDAYGYDDFTIIRKSRK